MDSELKRKCIPEIEVSIGETYWHKSETGFRLWWNVGAEIINVYMPLSAAYKILEHYGIIDWYEAGTMYKKIRSVRADRVTGELHWMEYDVELPWDKIQISKAAALDIARDIEFNAVAKKMGLCESITTIEQTFINDINYITAA